MRIGFIGLNEVGQTVLNGILLDGAKAKDISVCSSSLDVINSISSAFPGINSFISPDQVTSESDIIVLCSTESNLKEFSSIAVTNCQNKTIISLISGLSISSIQNVFNHSKVLRAVPGVAASSNIGIVAVAGLNDHIIGARTVLDTMGKIMIMSEEQLDQFTAVFSCGLRFASEIIDAYIKASEKYFGKNMAEYLTSQSFMSILSLIDERGLTSEEVIEETKKIKGSEEGMKSFNKEKLIDMIKTSMDNSYEYLTKENKKDQ